VDVRAFVVRYQAGARNMTYLSLLPSVHTCPGDHPTRASKKTNKFPSVNVLWPGNIFVRRYSSGREKLFWGFLHGEKLGRNTAPTQRLLGIKRPGRDPNTLRLICVVAVVLFRALFQLKAQILIQWNTSGIEICALLGCYAELSGNPCTDFSGQSIGPIIKRQEVPRPLKTGPIGCPETSVQDYHSTLRNIPEGAAIIYIATEACGSDTVYKNSTLAVVCARSQPTAWRLASTGPHS
jgi:hypothetical protein